jgi:hypothetical protein
MHDMPRAVILALAIVLATTGTSRGQAIIGESSPGRVSLIELYTSEGCSSCPSADRWFTQLRSQPGLWNRFVPVGFHVDYWDYLGWRDRFADARFSDRQRLYARVGRTSAVYTPGFIMDGREWRPAKRWKPAAQQSRANPGVLRLLAGPDNVCLEFAPASPVTGDLTANVALLGFGLETEVERGENSGRTLRHDFVVLALESVPLDRAPRGWSGQMALPVSALEAPECALAAWLTGQDRLDSVQAVGGWLPVRSQRSTSPQAAR